MDPTKKSPPQAAPATRGDTGAPRDTLSIGSQSGVPGDVLAPAQKPDEIGRLGPYRVLDILGEGGMGAVYKAEDPALKRMVALKVMLPKFAAHPDAKARFIREARAQAAVEHDHVIPIFQVDEQTPYLVMPLLKGQTLAAALKQNPRPPLAEVLRIAREIAEGLAAAHDVGLIHRDIKPANVWLEGNRRRVKVLDFGLARAAADAESAPTGNEPLTAVGAIVGTPSYMSPEQAHGHAVDHRSDLFSLGVLLYQMTTGRMPFTGPNAMGILTALITTNPPEPSTLVPELPPALNALIVRLLAKDPALRLPTAPVVAEELRQLEFAFGQTLVAVPIDPIPGSVPGVWAEIESTAPDEVVHRSTPATRTLPERRSIAPWLWAVAGLALLGAAALVAWQVIRITTPKGTLVIESNDPDAEVIVKGEGVTLRTKEREIVLKVGDYTIELAEPKTGLKLNTDKFEIEKDGKARVRVWLEKPKEVAKPKEPAAADPDRKAAEYVLSIGGVVTFNGDEKAITVATDLPKGPFSLTSVSLRSNKNVTDAGLASFKGCKSLTGLDLTLTSVTDEGLAHFKDCKSLERLGLWNVRASDAGLAHFKDCKSLTMLQLTGTQLSDAGLAHFKDCKNLTFLDLRATRVGDAGLSNFKDCKNLGDLYLGNTQVSDAGLAHFKDCKYLTVLMVLKTKVTKEAVAEFAKARPQCRIEHDSGVIAPKTEAEIDYEFAERVLKAGGHVIVTFPNFESRQVAPGERLPDPPFTINAIHISPTADPGAALGAAGDLSRIGFSVQLSGPAVTDDLLARLAGMPGADQLPCLIVSGERVSDAGLAHLKRMAKIHRLYLSHTGVGDAGLGHLRDLPALNLLELVGTGVTDAGLIDLARLAGLLSVNLTHTKVTEAGVKKLAAALPQCRIEWAGKVIEPTADPDRQAAEYVLSIGGRVQVNGVGTDIKAAANLPKARFKLTLADLENNLKVSDAGLATFKDCYNLIELNLSRTQVGNGGLAHFKNCKNLFLIILGGTQVTDEGMTYFKDCKGLSVLILSGTKIGNVGLANFKDCKNLTVLYLHNTQVTDEGLDYLKDCFKLKNLIVQQTKVTARWAAELAKAQPQCKIDYEGGTIGPTAAADPDRQAAEWVLSIGGRVMIRVNGRIETFASANQLPPGRWPLVGIDVQRQPQVNDAALARFQGCTALEHVDVRNNPVTEIGAAHFRNCKNLRWLAFSHTQVTDAVLPMFKDCTHLTMLGLADTRVTDAGLVHLRDYKNLTALALGITSIGDAGLEHLMPIASLAHINFLQTKVTQAGIAKLHAKLPESQIHWDKGFLPPARATDPNRRVAEWVLRSGGRVDVAVVQQWLKQLRAVDQLPGEPFSLTTVTFSLGLPLESHAFEYLMHFVFELKALERLGLHGHPLTDHWLAQIGTKTAISYLNARQTPITDAGLVHLAKLKLGVLAIQETAITDQGLATLASFSSLRHLYLKKSKVTEAGVKQLSAALPQCKIEWDRGVIEPTADPHRQAAAVLKPHVASLALRLAAGGLKYVAAGEPLPDEPFALGELIFENPVPAGFLSATLLPTLATLDRFEAITDPSGQLKFTEDELARLADCPWAPAFSTLRTGFELTPRNLETLKKFSDLTLVMCRAETANDDLVTKLVALRPWKEIGLTGLGRKGTVGEASWSALTSKKFGYLKLRGAVVPAAFARRIAAMPELIYLDLTGTDLQADALRELAACKKLQTLSLSGSSLTDTDLSALKGLGTLRSLGFTQTKTTEAGTRELAKALPMCQVVREGKIVEPIKK